MDPLIAYVLQQYGAAGFVGVLVVAAWWHIRTGQKESDDRYINLVNGHAEATEAQTDKYHGVVSQNIVALNDLKHGLDRLNDKINERCPPKWGH